jgi:nitrate/nitrite-specific signal transduction histidine kinase
MASHPRNRNLPHLPRRLALKACASGVLLCAAGFAAPTWAQQPLALSTAINRAGRLRALSQRIAKAYAEVVLDVMPDRAQNVMATALGIVKTNLTELGRAGFSADIAGLLNVCVADAGRLSGLVSDAPAAARLAEVNKAADQLLASADRLTGALESRGKSSAKIVNIAGRQRMLSQRMAKSFMLIEAGQDPAPLRKQLDTARSEFTAGLGALEAAPVSTVSIKQDLQQARTQWMFYQSALDGKGRATARRDVATTSERMLEIMDNLTSLYDAALKELLGSLAYSDTQYAALYPAS